MPLGVLDVSLVTDHLIGELQACYDDPGFWSTAFDERFAMTISGLAPDAVPRDDGCQLSLYLFHVEADRANRNTYPTGGEAQGVPEQPLALVLHYLLSAYSPSGHVEEQQAMTIGLKCFHERPFHEAVVPGGARQRVTMTLDQRSSDDAARLWQATGSPLRLSAAYRVAVTLLQPPTDPTLPRPVLDPRLVRPDDAGLLTERGVEVIEGQAPPDPSPVQATAGGFLTLTVAGVASGQTSVFVDRFELTEVPVGPLGYGNFAVTGPTTIQLRIHPIARGRYPLRVFPTPGAPSVDFALELG